MINQNENYTALAMLSEKLCVSTAKRVKPSKELSGTNTLQTGKSHTVPADEDKGSSEKCLGLVVSLCLLKAFLLSCFFICISVKY